MQGHESIILSIDPIAFRIGSWPVHWYGIIIGIGILVAYFLYMKEIERKGIDQDRAFDLMFWSIVIGFIGARIYYVAFSWEHYQDDLLSVFAIWQGGIAIYGGVIAGTLALVYGCLRQFLNMILMLDIATPALMAAQSIGRWGNFINQEAYGGQMTKEKIYSLPLPDFIINQMWIEGAYRQPTFLYESVWNLVGLVILLFLRRRPKFLLQGEIAGFYLIWYGIGRAYIEGLRTDSLYWGPFRVSQILSITLIIAGIIWVVYRRKFVHPPYYSESDIGHKGV